MEATFKMPTHPLCKEEIPGRKKKPNGEPVNGKMSRKLWVLTPGQLSSSQSLDGLLGHPLGSLQQFSKKITQQLSEGPGRDYRLEALGGASGSCQLGAQTPQEKCITSKLWVWRTLVAQGDQSKGCYVFP